MNRPVQRIAITTSGGGYVPGLGSVITGAVLVASEFGWDIVGIHDGFDGVLLPDRYPDGGVVKLTRAIVEHLPSAAGALLGATVRSDPFHVRTINEENAVEEVDRSDELMEALRAQGIAAVIAVADAGTLGILWKLHRKGLKTVCIPKSVENDIAPTHLSFGFNSALSFTVEMLDRARHAAQASRKLAVVEVPGEHVGWLALQAGMAVCADAVLIPEIPYDLGKVATKLRKDRRPGGLVVVAEGARSAGSRQSDPEPSAPDPLKAALSPGATGEAGSHVIERSGHAAETVALQLQRLTDREADPFVLGQFVKGGPPSAVDRQLGLAYGAGAVRALQENYSGATVAFQPPDMKFVPLTEAMNNVRTITSDSLFMQIARSLGLSLGD